MTVFCAQCMSPLQRAESHVLRVGYSVCSRSCLALLQKRRIEKVCKVCLGTFFVRPSEAKKYSSCPGECRVKAKKQEKNGNWKGGKCSSRKAAMSTKRYKEWRKSVFERDNFTCQICFVEGGDLNADHIFSWAAYPSLRYSVPNGRTLCVACHKTTYKRSIEQIKASDEYNQSIGLWKKNLGANATIAVDLDATLAKYDEWKGPLFIGEPIPLTVNLVKQRIAEGYRVVIFTARMCESDPEVRRQIETAIADWTEKHIGKRLQATNAKTYEMVEIWDDRAVQIVPNTGLRADGKDE